LQVEALRAELGELHQELARRDVELISALSRVAAVTDRLRLQTEQDRDDQHRLTRAIEMLTTFLASPPPGLLASAGGAPANPVGEVIDVVATDVPAGGTVIGGSIDPSLLADDVGPDRAIDLTAELPIAPATTDEAPLHCEVHLRFGDNWIDGFQIEETITAGGRTQFRLRRRVDGWVLPELFDESEVRVFTQPVVDPL
jgi:hypothetical protein